jgi:ABC-type dipeptide/oligopeptide/nickel transport system permease component
VTQSVILVGILAFVVINLCTDALYGLLDPRVRYQ